MREPWDRCARNGRDGRKQARLAVVVAAQTRLGGSFLRNQRPRCDRRTLFQRPVRNESLVIQDTLDHIAGFADHIVVYDDASTDNTLDTVKRHDSVALVVENKRWLPSIEDRLRSETRHRGLLLAMANQYLNSSWMMCCDADERYVGPIKETLRSKTLTAGVDGFRIRLFDAYMTVDDHEPYKGDRPLFGFRKWFGPERRDILMIWRNTNDAIYTGLDSREPSGVRSLATRFHCQHYGKSLSLEHWDETCKYYMTHFPAEPYGKKWEARLGKAIHEKSDFGRPLYPWGQPLFNHQTKEF